MGNPITSQTSTGTLGELLVQIKLLEYGVQAAPPIKDSGNDLVAIRGEIIKLVQVKTAINKMPRKGRLPKIYHLVALVKLTKIDGHLSIDHSEIWVGKKNENIQQKLDQSLVDIIWPT